MNILMLATFVAMVGPSGVEPPTSCLSGMRSNLLSYEPIWNFSQSLKIEQQTSKRFASHRLFVFFVSTRRLPSSHVLHRKEVIQPHLPIRLPCYDLTPITEPTFGSCPLAVSSLTSGVSDFHGLTGGVYKARERIHRGMLIRDY